MKAITQTSSSKLSGITKCPYCDGRGYLCTKQDSKRANCVAWLLDLLADGKPRKPSTIVKQATEQEFSRSILYQARNILKDQIINTRSTDNDPCNKWQRRTE